MNLASKISVKKVLLILSGCLFLFGVISGSVKADEDQDRLKQLNQDIEEYRREITRLNEEANTLGNQIAQYDAQIGLTTLKINQTEEKISLLGGRIELLEESLYTLTSAFTSRAEQTYKLARLNDEKYMIFLTADRLTDAVSSFHYLEKIQAADRELLIRLEKAQKVYKEEKVD